MTKSVAMRNGRCDAMRDANPIGVSTSRFRGEELENDVGATKEVLLVTGTYRIQIWYKFYVSLSRPSFAFWNADRISCE